ncbi:hypothetical protein L596_019556 [Steinernema carpocapsae]|uniref:Sulfotransferase domain-containing protein n=1 Tax=Steinernema carpocapsae TaxID=34508 RepID=A0A4U5MRP2_STECR|nr:hypothetical protein L596_019556 [Steinernema carpocapsae]
MKEFELQVHVDGKPYPVEFSPENVRSGKSIQTYPDDVLIATFPKCGTTWVRHIICQLMLEDYDPRPGKELFVYSPMIECDGKEVIDRTPRPRILKSHMTYGDYPKNPVAKRILVVRNPKDTLVSSFKMASNAKWPNYAGLTFDIFFDLFMEGKYAYGCYFEYHKDWIDQLKEHDMLLLKYEDMVKDLKTATVQIGEFLGGRAAEIVENPEKLGDVVEASTFKSMKEDQSRWIEGFLKDQQQFVRKGTPRDWKNYLNKEQSDRVDQKFKEVFKGTMAANWWQEEMKWED